MDGKNGKVIGYARVSTKEQNMARQLVQLKEYGCTDIYQEKVSGKNIEDRVELKKMMDFIRKDDEVVVISLDRLSRNNDDATELLQQIQAKGATYTILDMPSFNSIENPNLRKMLNNLVLEVFKYTAQNEREKLLERQRQGIAIAKRDGKYKGKVEKYCPTTTNKADLFKFNQIMQLYSQNMPKMQIAKSLGLSRTTVWKVIKKYGQNDDDIAS